MTITVGVAAVKTIAVTASPTSVGPNGGTVVVTATALDPSGGSLAGIPVTFSADHGGVDPGVSITDANGQATFQFVVPGTYPLSFTGPAGVTFVTDPVATTATPIQVVVASGQGASASATITSATSP